MLFSKALSLSTVAIIGLSLQKNPYTFAASLKDINDSFGKGTHGGTGNNDKKLKVDTYRANIAQTPTLDDLELKYDQLIGVAKNGTIMFVIDANDEQDLMEMKTKYSFADTDQDEVNIGNSHGKVQNTKFLIPGFIDTHVHASQFYNIGVGYNMELLPWLQAFTYPLEASFASPADGDDTGSPIAYVRDAYSQTVKKMLTQGTTTAAYYATIHPNATLILASEIVQQGQRAFVGKVNSDNIPGTLLDEDTSVSLKETEEWIIDMNKLKKREKTSLITPVISPRFAVGVTMELMKELGDLARKYDLPVQTHLNENVDEKITVGEMFPSAESYTDVYYEAGLFNVSDMILGHCVFLDQDEIDLITSSPGVGCSHCPLSNYALDSGIAPIRRYLEDGMPVGLGTDAAGGSSSSMIDVMKGAIMASKSLFYEYNRSKAYEPFNYHNSLYLATRGSANLMGLGDKIGYLAPGYQFDALEINVLAEGSPMELSVNRQNGKYGPKNSMADFLSKFIMEGDDRNIVKVWVDGKLVKQTNE
eukprot:Awhi_evm1s13725